MENTMNITPDITQYLDPNYPAFMRVDNIVREYARLMKKKISEMPNQKIYAQGPDGVLTPVDLFEEIKGGKAVLMPSQESVDAVVEKIIGQVKADVPEPSQSQVIERLNGLRPKYAL